VIVRSDIHDRLALPTESSTIKRNTWEETPKLHVAFEPMIERIKHLTSHDLLAMMLLHDFLSRHITPLQDCAHQAWMYTGEATPHDWSATMTQIWIQTCWAPCW
jgi:hypothetical protein